MFTRNMEGKVKSNLITQYCVNASISFLLDWARAALRLRALFPER